MISLPVVKTGMKKIATGVPPVFEIKSRLLPLCSSKSWPLSAGCWSITALNRSIYLLNEASFKDKNASL